MGFTFEALTGALKLDLSDWSGGFKKAEDELGKFSESTARSLAKAADTAGVSLTEMAEVGEKLANILGTDLGAAATMLADALENPTRGLQALRTAGLNVSEALESEVSRLASAGQAFDAHNAIIGRINESYSRLNTSLDDLDFSGAGNMEADAKRLASLQEEEEIKRRIEELDREEIAANLEYQKRLVDDMNAKWEEQEEIKKRAAEYANIPTGSRSFLERTNSEDAGTTGFETPGGGGLGGVLSSIPGAGMLGRLAPAAAAAAAVTAAVSEFSQAEEAAMRLESVLLATGNACGFTAEELQAMSEDLEANSRFTGEAIAEAQTFLATLKGIKGDTFKEVMERASDMAVVMGTDLPTAAEALGRALIDPENGLQRLQRAGIIFSESQKEQIKNYVALGEVAKAQRVILDEVAQRTQGAAAASTETLAGKYAKLKGEIGKLAEGLGKVLAPPLKFVIDLFRGGVLVLDKMIHPVQTFNDAIDFTARKLLQVRIAWNEFTGDVEEAAQLQETLKGFRAKDDEEETTGGGASGGGGAPVAGGRPAIAPSAGAPGAGEFRPDAVWVEGDASILKDGKGHWATPRAGENPYARKNPVVRNRKPGEKPAGMTEDEWKDYQRYLSVVRGIAAREQQAPQQAAENAHILGAATPEQAQRMAGGLRREAGDVVDALGLGHSERYVKKLMTIYRENLSQMKGFDAQAWGEMESRAVQAIRLATNSTGEMRAHYLDQLKEALKASETMFSDYADRLKEAEEKTADAAKKKAEEDKKKQEDAAKEAEEAAKRHVVTPGEALAANPADPYATLQGASKNDIQVRLAELRQQNQRNAEQNNLIGLGTPEQRKGLVELGKQAEEAMLRIRDSTGDARQANIEELQRIQEAWAKAYQAIREGSKETVEQLVADAKKQGDANEEAAKKSGDAKPAAGQPGDESFAAIGAQSRELGNLFSGAFGGRNAGLMLAANQFAEHLSEITDPIERIDAEIKQLTATINAFAINNDNYRTGLEGIASLQQEINDLQRKRQDAVRMEAAERMEADKQQTEAYKRSQVAKAEAEREAMRESLREVGVLVGKDKPNVTVNFEGVTDMRTFVDKLDQELNRRGVDWTGQGRVGRPR